MDIENLLNKISKKAKASVEMSSAAACAILHSHFKDHISPHFQNEMTSCILYLLQEHEILRVYDDNKTEETAQVIKKPHYLKNVR